MQHPQANKLLITSCAALTALVFACSSGGGSGNSSPSPAPSPAAIATAPGLAATPAQQPAQSPFGEPSVPMQTLILTPLDQAVPYSGSTLTLTFGVGTGAPGSTLKDYTFLCQTQSTKVLSACPGGASYTFTGLQNGSYSLTVEAVLTATSATALSETIAFTVQLPATKPASSAASGTAVVAAVAVGHAAGT